MIRLNIRVRFALTITLIGFSTLVQSVRADECGLPFSTVVFYEGVGAATSGICTADFTGDGLLDVAVANRGLDNVIIFKNDGDALFSLHSVTPIGFESTPRYVVSADFDGDGDMDAATSNWNAHEDDPPGYNGGSAAVLLNDGKGNLVVSEEHIFLRTSCIDLADLNGDGHVDIIAPHWDPEVGSSGPGIASVLKNNGDGTFVEVAEVPVGNLPRGIDVGDLDNDGDIDFAVSNMGSDDSVTVVENLGNFNFEVKTPLIDGTTPRYLAIGDLTGDGLNDILVVHKTVDTLLVYENQGNFNFSLIGIYPTAENPHSVEVEDINGDCSLDVLVSHVGENYVYIYENDGTGVLDVTVIESLHGPSHVISDDVNEDGRTDVLVACVNGGYFNVHISEVEQVGCTNACRADLDQSGTVDVLDIIVLITNWGETCVPSDVDGNGVVGATDIVLLISVWREPCQ
ncbi:MAG: VCBS repeat-containing protein [Phycisphaerales bacterium]|nr:VCBS repeat-containing protein [Planctomycetota bacterium]MBL6997902.1 VCBS repeat-containing protein [Phycisphaerales bacterium]